MKTNLLLVVLSFFLFSFVLSADAQAHWNIDGFDEADDAFECDTTEREVNQPGQCTRCLYKDDDGEWAGYSECHDCCEDQAEPGPDFTECVHGALDDPEDPNSTRTGGCSRATDALTFEDREPLIPIDHLIDNTWY